MPALLFGSISTVADTSELQRDAFNQAFEAHGLDWHWDRNDYRATLDKSGGAARISAYADARGETVDAAAVHATKSQIFQDSVAGAGITPRAGVVETIRDAKAQGYKVGLVTTTSPENVSALLDALPMAPEDFDTIVDLSDIEQVKPDRAAYAFALADLGEQAEDCVAIEDNVDGVDSAQGAGVTCVAFPNANTAGHDFSRARSVADHLDFVELRALVAS